MGRDANHRPAPLADSIQVLRTRLSTTPRTPDVEAAICLARSRRSDESTLPDSVTVAFLVSTLISSDFRAGSAKTAALTLAVVAMSSAALAISIASPALAASFVDGISNFGEADCSFAGWSHATITNAATAAVVKSDSVEIRTFFTMPTLCTMRPGGGIGADRFFVSEDGAFAIGRQTTTANLDRVD